MDAPHNERSPQGAAGRGVGPRGVPLRLALFVAVVLALIVWLQERFAPAAATARGCGDAEQTLRQLAQIDGAQAGSAGAARERVSAARLAHVFPRGADEAHENYLRRVREHLARECP